MVDFLVRIELKKRICASMQVDSQMVKVLPDKLASELNIDYKVNPASFPAILILFRFSSSCSQTFARSDQVIFEPLPTTPTCKNFT